MAAKDLFSKMKNMWLAGGVTVLLLLAIPIAAAIQDANRAAAARASSGTPSPAVSSSKLYLPTAEPPRPTTQPATTRAGQTQAAGMHGVTLYFTADAGAPVSITYSCGGTSRSSCQATAGTSVSVTGVASRGGVGMQCRISVDGKTLTSNSTRVGAQGGSLTCAAVVS